MQWTNQALKQIPDDAKYGKNRAFHCTPLRLWKIQCCFVLFYFILQSHLFGLCVNLLSFSTNWIRHHSPKYSSKQTFFFHLRAARFKIACNNYKQCCQHMMHIVWNERITASQVLVFQALYSWVFSDLSRQRGRAEVHDTWNLKVTGSKPVLLTGWCCFKEVPSLTPRPV